MKWSAIFVPLGVPAFLWAAVQTPGIAGKVACVLVAIGGTVYGFIKRKSVVAIDADGISLRSPVREQRVEFRQLSTVDKVWPSDRITGIKMRAFDGTSLLIGVFDYRDPKSLADELLRRIPTERISPRALRVLTAASAGKYP